MRISELDARLWRATPKCAAATLLCADAFRSPYAREALFVSRMGLEHFCDKQAITRKLNTFWAGRNGMKPRSDRACRRLPNQSLQRTRRSRLSSRLVSWPA